MVGKGTTSRLLAEASHEAVVYRVLRKVQGSAVPVFLGAIDLTKIYLLHGAGEISHILHMAWSGENISKLKQQPGLQQQISKSKNETRRQGGVHRDLRPENILWNAELERALIIDFHRYALDRRPLEKHMAGFKRSLCNPETRDKKRLRVK